MAKYTEFEVKGTPSFTLNLLIKAGVHTSEVKVEQLKVMFKVPVSEGKKAQFALEKARREYKILSGNSEENRPRNRIKNIPVLIGIITSIILVFSYSLCVFSVEVDGLKNVSEKDVLAVVKGYEKGVVFKNKIELKELEKELVRIPNVSHAKATINGSTLNIEIVERLSNTEILETQTMDNIVSKEDAIITKMIVVSGSPKVKVGDSVKKGDLLVEATRLDINGEPVPCPTEAVIEGRVWRVEKFSVEGKPNAETVDEIERRKSEFISSLPSGAKFIKSWYFIKRLDNASTISIYYEIINTIV